MVLIVLKEVHQARLDLILLEELALSDDWKNMVLLNAGADLRVHRCELEDGLLIGRSFRLCTRIFGVLIESLAIVNGLRLDDGFRLIMLL